MKQGRASTIKFNEWICLCAQHEKAISRIGRQIYQAHRRSLVEDYSSNETCKEITQTFADAKELRQELEENLERDALHGLSVEESKKAEEVLELSEGQKLMRKVRLKFVQLMGRSQVNRRLVSYKNRVQELSRDLGQRAVAQYNDNPIINSKEHSKLCLLAIKLEEESNKKWDEIIQSKKGPGGLNLSFHTTLISFIGSFAKYSQDTQWGKMVLKAMNYDSKEEEKKLTKQFEGSRTAAALEDQMSEVDESGFDIGRAMESMEAEYKEIAPAKKIESAKRKKDDWAADVDDAWPAATANEPTPTNAPAPEQDNTTPWESTYAPVIPSPARTPKPQALRKRANEERPAISSWTADDPFKAPSANPSDAFSKDEQSVDGYDLPAAPPATPPTHSLASSWPQPTENPAPPWPQPAKNPAPSRPQPAGNPAPSWPQPAKNPAPSRPQPAKNPAPSRPQPAGNPAPSWPQPAKNPAPSWQSPAFPPQTELSPLAPVEQPTLPPLPQISRRPLDLSPDSLDSLPPQPKALAPTLTSTPLSSQAHQDPKAPLSNSDDNLLPPFLRDKYNNDPLDASPFIPDFPDSDDSESINLKMLPFGNIKDDSPPIDDEPFIPEMPD